MALRKRPLVPKVKDTIPALINDLAYLNKMHKAASVLGKMGDAAIPELTKALKGRSALGAALALGLTKSPKAVPILIRTLKSDKRPFVRVQAATSLGTIMSSKAINPLLQALSKEKNIHVRVAAAASLGKMAEAGKLNMKQILMVDATLYPLLLLVMRKVKPLSLSDLYSDIINEVKSRINKARKKTAKAVPVRKKH